MTMQIKKTYLNVKAELLYDELKDFILKRGLTLSENKFDTYSLPTDSTAYIARGTLVFQNSNGKDCLRVHMVGIAVGETKLMLDIDESLFTQEKIKALQEDIDFVFGSYEVKTT
jgi:hypothetical protein